MSSHDLGFSQNLAIKSATANMLAVVGERIFDRMLMQNNNTFEICTLDRLIHRHANTGATFVYEPANKKLTLVALNDGVTVQGEFPKQVGDQADFANLDALLTAFEATSAENTETHQAVKCALVINAHLLFADNQHLDPQHEFKFIQALDFFKRETASGQHLIIWKTKTEAEIPSQLSDVDKVFIPNTTIDERVQYAQIRNMAKQLNFETVAFNQTLAKACSDCSLNEVETLFSHLQTIQPKQLEDISSQARAIKVGISNSAWSSSNTNAIIKGLQQKLTERVIGQSAAIDQVCQRMVAASVGLMRAGQGAKAMAPRAILFLGGPTGTGKTETIKALANEIYGSEEHIIRFDCGELMESHALNRLVGSPPGYIGYEAGGELTDAIKKNPGCIVLFDEIEKAHPKIFDMLLGVIDGGRLTDGKGATVFFGEAILAFTSNLGMYEETTNEYGMPTRKARFSYDTPFETLEKTMREAIMQEFINKLGRPELLGKIGGVDSLIIYDYIRDLKGIANKFLNNIISFAQKNHQTKVVIEDALIDHLITQTKSNPLALNLGARGLFQVINNHLISPLETTMFNNPNAKEITCSLRDGKVNLEAK